MVFKSPVIVSRVITGAILSIVTFVENDFSVLVLWKLSAIEPAGTSKDNFPFPFILVIVNS